MFSTKGDLANAILIQDIQNLMINLTKTQKFKLHVFPEKEGKKGIVTIATEKNFNADPAFASRVLELVAMISKKCKK